MKTRCQSTIVLGNHFAASRIGAGLPYAVAAFLLAACGESSTENVTQINQTGLDVVAAVADLPKCTAENEGEQALVKGETSIRVCVDGKWFATVASDGVADLTCSTKELANKKGVKILCGGDSIGVVLNGRDGKDGAQGIQGEQGVAGKDGAPGVAGTDGAGCTAETLADNSGIKVICGGDSVGVVLNGHDGAQGAGGEAGGGCSIVSIDCILNVKCGEDVVSLDIASTEDACREIVEVDSEKIAISLDEVSGVTQKGPFLSGSKVLVKELEDGRALTQTGNSFDGKILNDKGEFKIAARMLVSQYVMLEANGYYRDEITGGISPSTLTLFGITDVTTRNVVNINLLTHLEYERVIYLVTKKKMTVTKAKRQAQKEIFGLLDIDAEGFSNSEDLNIAGSSDEDGALLAFSVMFQGGRSVAQLTELLTRIATDMEKDGTWDDETTRMNIANWSADADSSGKLDTIRNNVAGWNLSAMVPNFEKYVRHFWAVEYGLDSCSAKNDGAVKAATAGKTAGTNTRYICKDDGTGNLRWHIANDLEKDTYGWRDSTDGALKNGAVTGIVYVFDSTGSFNGTAGWREASSIEKQYGGCRAALFDSIRTDAVYAYYYTCKRSTHTWVREVDYLLIDTQHWPDSTDGKVKWGDSVGVVDDLSRVCYVWDDAAQYRGWRPGNASDCELGLLGCTAKRGGEMRKSASGRYYSCSNNTWIEIQDEVYINTYLYRCTIDGEGDDVYKDGDLVYGIEMTTTRYACENEQWRATKSGEEKAGAACTVLMQGTILGDTITCDSLNWRPSIVYDFPVGKTWFNESLEYGTLEDNRDGRTYRTIKIGEQEWMAENLAYADSIASPYLMGQSWCYNDDSLNCLKGGRYYSWSAAMDVHSKWLYDSPFAVPDLIGNPHRGICPEGWHIPDDYEWDDMYEAAGYMPHTLQATGLPQWPIATNVSGFTALPVSIDGSGIDYFGEFATFWSIDESEIGVDYAHRFFVGPKSAQKLDYSGMGKSRGNMVRCVKD